MDHRAGDWHLSPYQLYALSETMTSTTATIDTILSTVAALSTAQGIPVVGISGFGGSGKSTLARQIASAIPNIAIVGTDEFWIPERDIPSDDWLSYDRDRLLREVILPAREGHPIHYHPFDWVTATPGAARMLPIDIRCLIVEGISATHPYLRPYLTLSIWVDCPLEVATARGLARGKEQGIDETEIWINRWAPNDRAYYARYRPDLSADLLYRTN